MRIFIFITMLHTIIFSEVINFHGYVPVGLNSNKIQVQYLKILKTLDSTASLEFIDPVEIIFYRKSEQRMHGIWLPEWGGGGALGKDTVVVPIDGVSVFYKGNLEQIITHELVHIVIARMYGRIRVPRWFHEGLAMTLSGEISFDEQVLLARAIVTRSIIPLDSIEFVNRFTHRKASLAYSQCHAAVTFLIDTYGIDLIPELLSAARKTRYFETACVDVFGLTIKEIEIQYVKELQKKYPLLMITSDVSLFWFFVICLSFVAFGVTMLRRRKRKAAMVIEEMAEDMENSTEADSEKSFLNDNIEHEERDVGSL